MPESVYAKTDKGREEIATRKRGVAARPRALLLMIDGQRSLAALASKLGSPEHTRAHLALLLEAGLIELVASAPAPPAAPTPGPEPAPVAASVPVKVSIHDIYSSRGPQR